MSTTYKKALLIGINYTGSFAALSGCINDSINLFNFLKRNNYFSAQDMVLMNDTSKNELYPSKDNIWKQLDSLVKFANDHANDNVNLFLSYSGHGTRVVDKNYDEKDGFDEALCPADFEKSGFIVDDELLLNFVNKLPAKTKLVVLSDCCHSGTIFDLKYHYKTIETGKFTLTNRTVTKCEVVMISGCQDIQTSADAYINNSYQGAMTAALLANYIDELSYKNLVNKMRKWLSVRKYTQVPELSSGKELDVNKPFLLSRYDDKQIVKKEIKLGINHEGEIDLIVEQ